MKNSFLEDTHRTDDFKRFKDLNISKEEFDNINKICAISDLNNKHDYDLNKIKEFISSIDDKKLQTNVYTLFLINYEIVAGLGRSYINELNQIFKMNEIFDINKDYLEKVSLFNVNSHLEFFIKANLVNRSNDALNFLEKNYTKEELNFNNFNIGYSFLYDINKNKEWFDRILKMELFDINNLPIKVTNSMIEMKTALEVIGKEKPIKSELECKTESFKYILSLGGDMNVNKLNKYFKTLTNDIEKAYINLKDNTKNFNELLNSIPAIIKEKTEKNNKDVLSKSSNIQNIMKEIDELINKYQYQIDLGTIGKTQKENVIKLTMENESKPKKDSDELTFVGKSYQKAQELSANDYEEFKR